MLHDPSHVGQIPTSEEISLSQEEKNILKQLGTEIADIAVLDCHKEKAVLWQKTNDLEHTRPTLWVNEIPWHEMNINDELTLKTAHPWARQLETKLRRTLFQWKYMKGDMIISPYIECEKVFHSTDFGIIEEVDTAITDSENEIYSRHFIPQIEEIEDIEKIKLPEITYMELATANSFNTMKEIFEGIIEVKLVGQSHIWYTPWDYLIRWWGIEQAMVDLYLRPEMVKAAYNKMVDAWMVELDQFDKLNLLELDCNNTRIGSGGYGYTKELPGDDFDGTVHPKNMWGCANAQIFSEVSPPMHKEFAIDHDLRWLNRFKLTYYGCCEPLHNKMEILDAIPNLRKVSTSAWADIPKMAECAKNKYVLSIKPSPAVFATESYDNANAKADLKRMLSEAKGCNAEIIMKDISTVKRDPQRLFDWVKMAQEVIEE